MSKCISTCTALCLVLSTFLFSSYSPLENISSGKSHSSLTASSEMQAYENTADTATTDSASKQIVILEDKEIADTIQYIKSGLGYTYTYKNQKLTGIELKDIIDSNAEASAIVSKVKGTASFLSILGYAGGALIGYPIGTWVGGGEPVWEMALIGCGLIAISIPIAIKADKDILKAVQLYNNGIAPTPRQSSRIELKVGMQSNGLGVALRF
jgi:hypothetical protein